MAAPRVWACAHVLRDLAGQEIPLSRDTAGARHSGISRGGALYCRAKLVCAARRKTRQHALRGRAEPPCPEAPAPKGAAVLPVQGLPPRGLWFISPLPAQPTRAGGAKEGY